MAECPHLEDSVLVDVAKLKAHSGALYCNACRTHKSPWLCLSCGLVHCGRYVNGHAKSHQEAQTSHRVCMDSGLVAFCYECDDSVINDTPDGRIQAVRNFMLERERALDPSMSGLEPPSKSMKTSTASEHNSSSSAAAATPLHKLAGLRNLGNTCFMNSVLQSLSNIQDFCFYFRRLPAIAPPCNGRRPNQYHTRQSKPEEVCLVEEFRKIISDLTEAKKATAISPDALFSALWKVAPSFRGYQQQDAHEFMRYLLDRLHYELVTLVDHKTGDSTTIVNRMFGGVLRNEVDCLECRQKSIKHDPFLDLSLGIPERFAQRKGRGKEKELGVCHLKDCISHFCDMEELSDTEQYLCEKCRQRQRSTKKFYLRDLPPVLCLHLKRFRYALSARSKLDLFVEFPLEGLDLKDFMSPNAEMSKSTLYDLSAVVVHHGSGVGSGHYTAYGHSAKAGGWFHFNDSTVTCSTADAVSNCKAYLLFYLQRPLGSCSTGVSRSSSNSTSRSATVKS
ncbi:ubiquitin carboxyl-terminal hydrolase 3-like [Sycon ciliatum]|uniref:ubiquitin carboxyl-terminal hydrolase 3-like n=1 Tax=Sycon ciliatum TaxID=27933 RepID=UPI0031F6AEE4|eukprot:scpid65832/ scgid7264/ Ubiquitin carboxyl-terminal hydrolase 3; Deubiquitinating enzyme 3; Ubiquitin thioesterase 3; Ubiquitin-specific-processing protease 3